MTVDFHTHAFPPGVAEKVIGSLQRSARAKAHILPTLPELKKSMEKAGVDRSVVLPVATSPEQVSTLNRLSVTANAEWAERGIFSFGAMHPDCPDWKEELRFIARHDLRGVKLHPPYQQAPFDDLRFLRILDECAALGLIVTVHAGQDIGVPGEWCSPEQVLRALDQVRPDKLVLAHLGGWRQWDEVAEKLAGLPVYFDTAFALGTITPAEGIERAEDDRWLASREQFMAIVKKHGARRILFATDSPWGDQASMLTELDAMPLSPAENAAIRGGNAARLLGLENT